MLRRCRNNNNAVTGLCFDTYKIKYKTRQVVATFLACLFAYMAVDAMNKRRSGVCLANTPLLLGLAAHCALGLANRCRANIKPRPRVFQGLSSTCKWPIR